MSSHHLADWSPQAVDLLRRRYFVDTGETIEQWISAIVDYISTRYAPAMRRRWRDAYFELLRRKQFLPTTALLRGARIQRGSLAGCTVVQLQSDFPAALRTTIPNIAEWLLDGTGVGLDFTVVAPRLWRVRGAESVSAGAAELLRSIIGAVERPINYAGVKRPAFMASIFVTHPDVFELMSLKQHERLNPVNVSIAIDDVFHEAVLRDGWLPLSVRAGDAPHFVTEDDVNDAHARGRALSLPSPDLEVRGEDVWSSAAGCVVGRNAGGRLFLRARTALDVLARAAHDCGDPGILNLGVINRRNPTHPLRARGRNAEGAGVIHTTAPCGEQPLLPDEVCQLGSVNLPAFITRQRFDFDAMAAAVAVAVRFMDDAIDVASYPNERARELNRRHRKLGIGIMGLADALAELELPYASAEAREFAASVARTIRSAAEEASEELAVERGPWEGALTFGSRAPRRHATLTSIAPTGNISMLAGSSPGIEPYFRLRFRRTYQDADPFVCQVLERKLADRGYSLEQWVRDTTAARPDYTFDGTLRDLVDTPPERPELRDRLAQLKLVFRTAHEISAADQLQMVAALRDYVDNGISKTVNVPNEATVDEVRDIFLTAMDHQITGITVFRDRCRQEQALVS